MRYWVPNHEMEMCGHAAVGAVWALQSLHLLPDAPSIRISTLSGVVEARIVPSPPDSTSDTVSSKQSILVSQPTGIVGDIDPDHILEILSSLNLKETDLIPGLKIQNARTSRTKTLIPVKDRATLGSLLRIQNRYTFRGKAVSAIAGSALVFGLVQSGVVDARTESPIVVRQGWLMGKPSEIRVLLRRECGVLVGCWISGDVRWVRD
ncbi:hypothetical protein N7493_006192 [Penicillium malachiteum]|uniref:Uncharacterized protein n=1 Tax=Penicillium malachiteum TaxID=1324776 RepID=A0AAD6HKI7_9EURO|nr:hypothetical protein N7493_006192 [Penicillium malachiteum]